MNGPFSLLNDEQMSNKVGVEHQPDNVCLIYIYIHYLYFKVFIFLFIFIFTPRNKGLIRPY